MIKLEKEIIEKIMTRLSNKLMWISSTDKYNEEEITDIKNDKEVVSLLEKMISLIKILDLPKSDTHEEDQGEIDEKDKNIVLDILARKVV